MDLTQLTQFLDKNHSSIVLGLKKPFRNPDDISILKYLLTHLGDLKPYTQNLSEAQKSRLCRHMYYQDKEAGEMLFHQGDTSDRFYVILKGIVELVHTDVIGITKVINIMGMGRSFGEKGLIQHATRSLGVKCRTNCEFIYVKADDFDKIIRDQIDKAMRIKVDFVSQHILNLKRISHTRILGIACILWKIDYKQGETIVEKGSEQHRLTFIISGECVVKSRFEGHITHMRQDITNLRVGSWFNEEWVLFNQPANYTIIATSNVETYQIRKQHINMLFPEEAVNHIKEQYAHKEKLHLDQERRLRQISPPRKPQLVPKIKLDSVTTHLTFSPKMMKENPWVEDIINLKNREKPIRFESVKELRAKAPVHLNSGINSPRTTRRLRELRPHSQRQIRIKKSKIFW